MKRVYIAGPFGAREGREDRVKAAIDVADEIRRAGLFPFVPHLYAHWEAAHPHDYECWMRLCFAWLPQCEAVFRMDGDSPGADREVALAYSLNIPVFLTMHGLLSWAGVK